MTHLSEAPALSDPVTTLLDPQATAPPPFPAKSTVLDFATTVLRNEPNLHSDALVDLCYDHFSLEASGVSRDDFQPHIINLLDDVARRDWPPPSR